MAQGAQLRALTHSRWDETVCSRDELVPASSRVTIRSTSCLAGSPCQEQTGFQLLGEAVKTTPGQSGASELPRAPAFLPPQAGDRDDLAREKLVASGRPPRPQDIREHREAAELKSHQGARPGKEKPGPGRRRPTRPRGPPADSRRQGSRSHPRPARHAHEQLTPRLRRGRTAAPRDGSA
ncbi:unnamed protein product [Rangifer tarandus platyrhynchus]|uniref:Uncharacterized protein n=1 Tax=Rangifer tarandus platyrhynchus TaxID=3082113 RepID=A0ABN8YU62_RANTA|nr:unnamed protein product [Rangifer tarandus platyrhynchus]